jgi:lipopolysaccharide transport system permease protein/teichoic acid transport system permease protein
LYQFFRSILQNKKILLQLTKNDFKQKYVGNLLGALWAFIQPTITILIFWFVFQVGFKSKPVGDFPFILWLISGMIPWFFFAEALSNGTNSVIANSFLVKKIVFRISLLPIIPLLSALVIHLFFIFFMFGMFLYYGITPTIYWIQIFYYLFAMSILLLGLSWITASVIVFFKDMGQIVAMVIQFGFWLTPIFWSIDIIPQQYHWIIELNPLVYIIEGYRDSLIHHQWFWEKPTEGIYFWVISMIIFLFGAWLFQKLRPHFADVL